MDLHERARLGGVPVAPAPDGDMSNRNSRADDTASTTQVRLASSSILEALSDLKKRTTVASRKPSVISADDLMVQVTHGPVENDSGDPVIVESPAPLGVLIQELLRHLNNQEDPLAAIIIPLLTNGKIKFESEGRFKRLQIIPVRSISATGARRILDDYLQQIRNGVEL